MGPPGARSLVSLASRPSSSRFGLTSDTSLFCDPLASLSLSLLSQEQGSNYFPPWFCPLWPPLSGSTPTTPAAL